MASRHEQSDNGVPLAQGCYSIKRADGKKDAKPVAGFLPPPLRPCLHAPLKRPRGHKWALLQDQFARFEPRRLNPFIQVVTCPSGNQQVPESAGGRDEPDASLLCWTQAFALLAARDGPLTLRWSAARHEIMASSPGAVSPSSP